MSQWHFTLYLNSNVLCSCNDVWFETLSVDSGFDREGMHKYCNVSQFNLDWFFESCLFLVSSVLLMNEFSSMIKFSIDQSGGVTIKIQTT